MVNTTPVLSGLKGRCHVCDEGSVFAGYLKLKTNCDVCQTDFSAADTGDGPSFFVMFAAMILFVPFFMMLPLIGWPLPLLVLGFALIGAAMMAFILWGLRVGKAILLNLQLANGAEEAKFE
ncbi:MAG: DUF983 domain-containing protein [Pseudomonadota bacterium]